MDDWVGTDIYSCYRVLLPLVGRKHGSMGLLSSMEWKVLVRGIASWLPHIKVKKKLLKYFGLVSYNDMYLHLSFLFVGGKWLGCGWVF